MCSHLYTNFADRLVVPFLLLCVMNVTVPRPRPVVEDLNITVFVLSSISGTTARSITIHVFLAPLILLPQQICDDDLRYRYPD